MQQTIGRYQILEEIAAGGQGTVYRAYHPDTRQIIALKVLHPTLSGDRTYIERFRREASLAASIDHPNVVKIFEVGQDGDKHFMALEFLPESLARVIESGPQMPIDAAAQFGLEVADGLAAAHALGIVHRDVKPQNVLIGADGTAKVTDFGIARAESLATMTATGVMMGTPHYMSPEQSRGERADARSDVYSLGCMVYQMLAGEVPFKGDTPLAVIRQQIDEQPRRLRELRSDLPRRLEAVVERSMAKDPGRRYQSVAEMAQALRAAVPGLAEPARAATAPKAPAPPDSPRQRGAVAAPRPAPVGPRGGARQLSRLRSLVRISAAVVLLLWGLFLFAPAWARVSERELISAILLASGGIATVSASVLILRRTKFKKGTLGWGRLSALLIVLGFVLLVAGLVKFPGPVTTPERERGPLALAPAPTPTATPTMPPAPNATPPLVIAPAVPPTPSPTRTLSPTQSQSPITSEVETPVPVVVAPATLTPTPTSTPTPVLPTATLIAPPVSGRIAFTSLRDGNREIYVMNAAGTGQFNLTSHASDDYWPAWSPDGTRIAFYSQRDGNHEIYSMNADGSSQTNLSRNLGHDMYPAWSPDGTKVAFQSNRDGNWEIYVMNGDGSGQVNRSRNLGDDMYPAWSPDGTKVAFTSNRDGNEEIYVMNVDGSGGTRLTNNPADDFFPAWSPDGAKITFSAYREGNGEIYIMNADGTGRTVLTNNETDDFFPAWSPDGTKISFSSDRDGNWEIYVMNADGTGQTRLTSNSAEDFGPAWSPITSAVETTVPAQDAAFAPPAALPASGRIVFVSSPDLYDDIYVMNADGSGQTNLTNYPTADEKPAWSPDGAKIVFTSQRVGLSEIYVMNADGTDLTRLTNNASLNSSPAWAPDGAKIAFIISRVGEDDIYVMNADGSGQTRLTTIPGFFHWSPTWSPDGAKIAFGARSRRGGRSEIYVINADGTGQTKLTNNDTADVDPAWSPDGTKIAFRSRRDGNDEIYVMNADGTGQTRLTNNPTDDRQPSWSPDGGKIVFTSLRDGGPAEVYVMNADGTGQTRVTNNDWRDDSPAWSPIASVDDIRSPVSPAPVATDSPCAQLQSGTYRGDVYNVTYLSRSDTKATLVQSGCDLTGSLVIEPPLMGSGPLQGRIILDAVVFTVSGETNDAGLDIVFTGIISEGTLEGSYTVPGTGEEGEWRLSPSGTPARAPIPPPPLSGRIAFASDRDGNLEIYVMNADGTGQTRLTNNDDDDLFPGWSPDGTKIVFSSDRDGIAQIYVMNADGTGQTRLTNNAGYDVAPVWSPDGAKIVFSSDRDGNNEIYVMNADGTGQTRLTTNNEEDLFSAWSPDGAKIAFVSNRDGNDGIYVMNSDGTGQTRITNNAGSFGTPAWSPDGTKITFGSIRDGNLDIYVMSADGTGQIRLTDNLARDVLSAWSPDGTKIAFSSDREFNFEIYVMSADGTGLTRLTINCAVDFGPAWSPIASGVEAPAPTQASSEAVSPVQPAPAASAPVPCKGEEEAQAKEYQNIILAVGAMMVDNRLTSIPNPNNGASGGCMTGTNQMSAWPDTISDWTGGSNGKKSTDPNGNSFAAGDKAGYLLYTHDITGDGSAAGTVKYMNEATTPCSATRPRGLA
jgi:Tol biopolymer transport system component